MAVRVTLDGLDDLRESLQHLPQDLATKAAGVVQATARQMGQELETNYPLGKTGNLRRGVRVSIETTSVSVRGVVRSAAPHAHLFEYGTGRRQTTSGANRGTMPKGPTDERLGPQASRARKRMFDQLIAIVQEAGLTVSGT